MAENHTQSSYQCSDTSLVSLIYHTFLAFKAIITLPCAVMVLHLGHLRWRQRRSSATTSHTDVLTYNVVVFDLIFNVGLLLYICGKVSGLLHLITISYYISNSTFPGSVLLHVLTCLERYLAVIHPVIYLKLRHSSGTRIRNGFLVCTWLLCLGWGACRGEIKNDPLILTFFLLAFAMVAVTLSSLRVLVALIRPKPGEGGRANQSRLRAFQTMTVITGTLWMWFLAVLVTLALSRDRIHVISCVVLVSGYWFTLPSHLVLPLLYLHRAGKLTGCKSATNNNTN